MKSCEAPRTQPMHKITFEGDMEHSGGNNNPKIADSYFYTQYPPLPYSNHRHCQGHNEEVQDFHYRNNTSNQSMEEAMIA